MAKKILTFFLFLIIVHGCSSSIETGSKFVKGTYHFKMSDSLGNRIADGTITVKTVSNNHLAGTYNFSNIYKKDFPSLGVMEGEFTGEINAKEKLVFINTNPKIADSNVFWYLNIRGSSLSGEWIHSTFRGPSSKGKVEISK